MSAARVLIRELQEYVFVTSGQHIPKRAVREMLVSQGYLPRRKRRKFTPKKQK